MKWKRLLARDANILTKYLVLRGIELGPKYILSGWKGMKNQFWSWKDGETGIHFLVTELKKYADFVVKASKAGKNFASDYETQSFDICNEVVRNIEKIAINISSKTSNTKLIKVFKEFCDEYIRLGSTIVMTLEEIQIVQLDNCGNPFDSEWSHLIAKPLSTPVTNKYEMRRIARRLWTDAGNTNKVPCYTVPISKGWLAIFGGYGRAITVLVDADGKVYDSTWVE